MSPSDLSPSVFAILSALVEEKLGVLYGPAERELFGNKVAEVIAESGFESPIEYYYALRYDDPLGLRFDVLADTLLVGETYFFREAAALDGAIDNVVAVAIASRGYARVLSAACSTGEEPLTMAMILSRRGLLSATEIIAIDIGTAALAKAEKGLYGARSFRGMPEWANAFFHGAEGRRQVDDALRRKVDFRRINILNEPALKDLGTFDLVVCRNVLIYFRDETIVRVVRNLADRLRRDGRLLVGASESLMRFGTLLHCEERAGTFLYARDPR